MKSAGVDTSAMYAFAALCGTLVVGEGGRAVEAMLDSPEAQLLLIECLLLPSVGNELLYVRFLQSLDLRLHGRRVGHALEKSSKLHKAFVPRGDGRGGKFGPTHRGDIGCFLACPRGCGLRCLSGTSHSGCCAGCGLFTLAPIVTAPTESSKRKSTTETMDQ